MKFLKVTLLIIMAIATVSLVGCDKEKSNKEIAEVFIKEVLTLPNEDIALMAKLDVQSVGSEEIDEKMSQTIMALYGGDVSKTTLTDGTSRFYNDVVMLHVMAAVNNFTYAVESIEVTELDEKQFSYTAEVLASNEANGKLTITGSVQFDDDGKINFMTVKR